MTKLKLAPLQDAKPMRKSLEFPAHVWRDLELYAAIIAKTSGRPPSDPIKLVVPMVERFMATDRAFAKARRAPDQTSGHEPQT